MRVNTLSFYYVKKILLRVVQSLVFYFLYFFLAGGYGQIQFRVEKINYLPIIILLILWIASEGILLHKLQQRYNMPPDYALKEFKKKYPNQTQTRWMIVLFIWTVGFIFNGVYVFNLSLAYTLTVLRGLTGQGWCLIFAFGYALWWDIQKPETEVKMLKGWENLVTSHKEKRYNRFM